MDIKKKAVVEAYKKAFGNVSVTMASVGIDRTVFYDWLKADAEFKEAIDNVQPEEVFVDFAENALTKRIQDGDTTAIIFALKTKGKKRGYIERVEQDVKLNAPNLPDWINEGNE